MPQMPAGLRPARAHTHTHTPQPHARIHTHTNTHTHTHTHTSAFLLAATPSRPTPPPPPPPPQVHAPPACPTPRHPSLLVCVCVCVCVRACVRACARACVRVCVCWGVPPHPTHPLWGASTPSQQPLSRGARRGGGGGAVGWKTPHTPHTRAKHTPKKKTQNTQQQPRLGSSRPCRVPVASLARLVASLSRPAASSSRPRHSRPCHRLPPSPSRPHCVVTHVPGTDNHVPSWRRRSRPLPAVDLCAVGVCVCACVSVYVCGVCVCPQPSATSACRSWRRGT